MELQVRMDYREKCCITKEWIIYRIPQNLLVCCDCVRDLPCSDPMSQIIATSRPRNGVRCLVGMLKVGLVPFYLLLKDSDVG
jgi:hypothetical protein